VIVPGPLNSTSPASMKKTRPERKLFRPPPDPASAPRTGAEPLGVRQAHTRLTIFFTFGMQGDPIGANIFIDALRVLSSILWFVSLFDGYAFSRLKIALADSGLSKSCSAISSSGGVFSNLKIRISEHRRTQRSQNAIVSESYC